MIVAIIDVVGSRDVNVQERQRMDQRIRGLLNQTYERFQKHCGAVPSLTQGDSIELLVRSWLPIVYLIHRLLLGNYEFRVGLGTGKITLLKENADECDGPAFWNARESLNEIKSSKQMNRPASFRIDDKSPNDENSEVINSILFFALLLGLTRTQVQRCFYHIWEKKSISEIAEIAEVTKGSVSRSLSDTSCYLLKEVIEFLERKQDGQ